MAPYQKPTVEEVEDEYRRTCSENGIRMFQPFELASAVLSSAVATEAKRLRKRKCPWDNAPRLGKMKNAVPAYCR